MEEGDAIYFDQKISSQWTGVFHGLEGTLRFKIGTEELIMEEGDAIYFDASIPHGGISADGRPLVCLMVIYSGEAQQRPTHRTS